MNDLTILKLLIKRSASIFLNYSRPSSKIVSLPSVKEWLVTMRAPPDPRMIIFEDFYTPGPTVIFTRGPALEAGMQIMQEQLSAGPAAG
jgi:hypothetical protein